jgi:hypothetical protein
MQAKATRQRRTVKPGHSEIRALGLVVSGEKKQSHHRQGPQEVLLGFCDRLQLVRHFMAY